MKLSGRNVLLVGRNFNSARALKNRLHRWKFQCHFASDMRAASDLLRSQPVDLVLSDNICPMELALTCWWRWPIFRLPRSSACQSKIAAFGCPPSMGKKMFGNAVSPTFGVWEDTRRNGTAFTCLTPESCPRFVALIAGIGIVAEKSSYRNLAQYQSCILERPPT